jgi:hypothetical protein
MRRALDARNALPVLAWAVPDVLAVTQRPLRAHPVYGGSRQDYPSEARQAIDAWVAALLSQQIKSVIVLTSNKELDHYLMPTRDAGGLLALYRRAGLEVVHFPADDPAHDLTAKAAFDTGVEQLSCDIGAALRTVSRPAVLHCSAAIDRSPPIAARVAFLAELDCL